MAGVRPFVVKGSPQNSAEDKRGLETVSFMFLHREEGSSGAKAWKPFCGVWGTTEVVPFHKDLHAIGSRPQRFCAERGLPWWEDVPCGLVLFCS